MALHQAVICTFIVLLLSPSLVRANTLVVSPDGSGDHTDIQSALDAARDGDTVLVQPGIYQITAPIDFNRLHDPEDPSSPAVKNITLRSERGADETVIRPRGDGMDIGAYEYAPPLPFLRSDANGDGNTDISDAIRMLFYLFRGGEVTCLDAADVNDDGLNDVSDVISLLSLLFLDGPAPAEPFGECGTDTTPDPLTCEEHAACP